MFFWFVIKGQSMEPFCREGDFVVANRMTYLFFRPKVGQIVVLKDPRNPSRLILKRITDIQGSFFWVEGDNQEESTDSRNFGLVPRKNILGKARVIHRAIPLTSGILL